MRILVTNDDGYNYKGLKTLVEILRPLGELVVVAPKYHQSGMSMAVSLGFKPLAVKKFYQAEGEQWWYVDATPASCVKWGLDEIFAPGIPDLVVSGINHGANTASAVLYSGTLGAAQEGALAGVLSVGVSLDELSRDPDFSAAKELFPSILQKIIESRSSRFGVYYNVNFPNLPAESIKGVKAARQGIEHWDKEFRPFDGEIFSRLGITPASMGIPGFPEVEPGEQVYMMAGDLTGDSRNTADCDNILLKEGFVTVSAHNIDTTDRAEYLRLQEIFDK